MTRRGLLILSSGLLVLIVGLMLLSSQPGEARTGEDRAAALEALTPLTIPPPSTPPPVGDTPTPTSTPVDKEFMPYVVDTASTATATALPTVI